MSPDFHKSRCALSAAVLAVILLLPQTASANAGTPLIWGTALHMLLGNAVIGMFEGLLLSRIFEAPVKRGILVMILANYLSAWFGGWTIFRVTESAAIDINNVRGWFWMMAGVTYGATLLVEWPFVGWSLRSLKRSVLASLTVQTVSYVLLFGFYWMISVTTEIVHELKSTNLQDRLSWQADEAKPGQGDLVALLDEGRSIQCLELRKGLSGQTRQSQRSDRDTWQNFGPVEPVQPWMQGRWDFIAGFWAAEGLWGESNTDGKEDVHLAIETPVVAWPVRNAVILPGEKVLFQFGRDQICVFDPETKRVALLCRGRGPVAVTVPDDNAGE